MNGVVLRNSSSIGTLLQRDKKLFGNQSLGEKIENQISRNSSNVTFSSNIALSCSTKSSGAI
jgi:hypothetical protein